MMNAYVRNLGDVQLQSQLKRKSELAFAFYNPLYNCVSPTGFVLPVT
jgi:hypothetical protein